MKNFERREQRKRPLGNLPSSGRPVLATPARPALQVRQGVRPLSNHREEIDLTHVGISINLGLGGG